MSLILQFRYDITERCSNLDLSGVRILRQPSKIGLGKSYNTSVFLFGMHLLLSQVMESEKELSVVKYFKKNIVINEKLYFYEN